MSEIRLPEGAVVLGKFGTLCQFDAGPSVKKGDMVYTADQVRAIVAARDTLASFAHEVYMGAYKLEELQERARAALIMAAAPSIDDICGRAATPPAPQEPTP
jgi:hypothetical protein